MCRRWQALAQKIDRRGAGQSILPLFRPEYNLQCNDDDGGYKTTEEV